MHTHAAKWMFLAIVAVSCGACQTFTNSPYTGHSFAQRASRQAVARDMAARGHLSDRPVVAATALAGASVTDATGTDSPLALPLPPEPVGPAVVHAHVPAHGHSCPSCRSASSGPVGLPAAATGADGLGEMMRPPYEEFVCNGGDQNVQVHVQRDWTVRGLHPGDTVAHYDTLDGRTLVEPSNEVCLYAPRFAAVRKVYGVIAHEQHDRPAGVALPVGPELSTDLGLPTTVTQPLQPAREHAITSSLSFLEKQHGVNIDNALRPEIAEERFLPFEDLTIIRRGHFDNSEKARLAERLQAAITWSHTQSPQVIVDNKTAVEEVGTKAANSVFTYVMPPGKARLRIVKIASKQNAQPGDLVEFTLRFDNVGDQPIGNVTIIDRLHDRLEYVEGSQNCSLAANFLSEDEDGFPRVLRWEVTEPMEVGEGGLIRFTCRVR